MAIWTEDHLSNLDGYIQYKKVIEYAKKERIAFRRNLNNSDDFSFFLSIEDLRIIGNDLSRLNGLYSDGVRFASLFWKGTNQFGGAWDTDLGLSNFGIDVLIRMLELGIIPDISHSSAKSTQCILELCDIYKKSPLASHSNLFSACNHKRNISNEHFKELIRLGGILGVSLCPEHLSNKGFAAIDDVLRHIDAFLCLGGENNICFGCDFDGVSELPLKIRNIMDISKIHLKLTDLYGEAIANKIFFNNAYSFMNKNLA